MSGISNYGNFAIYTTEPDDGNHLEHLFKVVDELPPFPIYEGQRVVNYPSFDYGRVFFNVSQPPIFMVDIAFAELTSDVLSNYFHYGSPYFALNLTNIVWVVLLTIVTNLILRELGMKNHRILSLLLIWVNPAVLLTFTYQGMRDALMLLLLELSIYAVITNRFRASGIYTALAVMTKPTVLFSFPALFWASLNRKKICWFGGTLLFVAIVYLLNDSVLGMVQGIISMSGNLRRVNGDISLWSWLSLYDKEYINQLPNLNQPIAVYWVLSNVNMLALFVQIAAVAYLIWRFRGFERPDPLEPSFWYISFLIATWTHMTRLNAQDNHWLYIMAFAVPAIAHPNSRNYVLSILAILSIQDFIAQGLGRSYKSDFMHAVTNSVDGSTVVLSIICLGILIHATRAALVDGNNFRNSS